ncbi:MAG: hypothetical protein IJ215_02085 [Clostridia bacterium]|nr:hypothetical protein [Clostridia bacterium]
MEKLFEKFNNKKMIENLVIFLILAIIVIIVINSMYGDNTSKTNIINTSSRESDILQVKSEASLEDRLAHILSFISGAGSVEVMISYKNEIEKIPMTDMKTTTTVTNEKDSNGGERKTEQTSTEQSVIYAENGSNKTPVIQQTMLPEIVGVIVVADGAGNMSVKENLIKAVEATIDVPSHRIQVFAK